MTIYDVTNKIGNTTKIISRTSYVGARYIHQGAVLDRQNQEFIVLDDELDERDATEGPATNKLPTTYILDIRDLEKPKVTGFYQGKTRSIDHNQYVIDGYNYQCKPPLPMPLPLSLSCLVHEMLTNESELRRRPPRPRRPQRAL